MLGESSSNYHELILQQYPKIPYDEIDPLVKILQTADRELPKSMPLKLIKEKAMDLIAKEFRTGHHKKPFGKKMRQKLDGRVITHHSKIYRTYFIYKIFYNKKGVNFEFSTINYVNTPTGIIYIHRHGGAHPELNIFTGHFFDRLMERGYGKDARSRESAILTYLLDHIEVQKDISFTVNDADTGNTHTFMGHGLAIGHSLIMNSKPEYSFAPELHHPDEYKENVIQVRFFLTYISLDMMNEYQKSLVSRGMKVWDECRKTNTSVLRFVLPEE